MDAEGNINTEVLTDRMNTALAEHDITVPEEATQIIADALAEEFTGEELTSLTIADITDRLIEHLSDLPDLDQLIGDLKPAA